jgi:hypothetical protein
MLQVCKQISSSLSGGENPISFSGPIHIKQNKCRLSLLSAPQRYARHHVQYEQDQLKYIFDLDAPYHLLKSKLKLDSVPSSILLSIKILNKENS